MKKTIRSILIMAIALAGLSLAGCGSSPAVTPGAVSLLTPAQIQAYTAALTPAQLQAFATVLTPAMITTAGQTLTVAQLQAIAPLMKAINVPPAP